ncbi:hypothetical protein GW17_00027032 [Ensete ventricosum]|nr:hypothetical protein GW17_00027032 [Ensete ventricosum]
MAWLPARGDRPQGQQLARGDHPRAWSAAAIAQGVAARGQPYRQQGRRRRSQGWPSPAQGQRRRWRSEGEGG